MSGTVFTGLEAQWLGMASISGFQPPMILGVLSLQPLLEHEGPQRLMCDLPIWSAQPWGWHHSFGFVWFCFGH